MHKKKKTTNHSIILELQLNEDKQYSLLFAGDESQKAVV
jgi:hypothetical protein